MRLVAVKDVPAEDFHEGDTVQFLDGNGEMITTGTVERILNNAVHIQYLSGGTQAPGVGDLAVRSTQASVDPLPGGTMGGGRSAGPAGGGAMGGSATTGGGFDAGDGSVGTGTASGDVAMPRPGPGEQPVTGGATLFPRHPASAARGASRGGTTGAETGAAAGGTTGTSRRCDGDAGRRCHGYIRRCNWCIAQARARRLGHRARHGHDDWGSPRHGTAGGTGSGTGTGAAGGTGRPAPSAGGSGASATSNRVTAPGPRHGRRCRRRFRRRRAGPGRPDGYQQGPRPR